jgi:hypothetical protein
MLLKRRMSIRVSGFLEFIMAAARAILPDRVSKALDIALAKAAFADVDAQSML